MSTLSTPEPKPSALPLDSQPVNDKPPANAEGQAAALPLDSSRQADSSPASTDASPSEDSRLQSNEGGSPGAPQLGQATALMQEHSARLRVLLVEDDAGSAEAMSNLLHFWGCEVLTAPDGEMAIREAALFRPDIALIDIHLPKLDGYQVAQQLHQDSRLRMVPLVAISGSMMRDELRARAHRAGFTSFLVKPIDPEQLRSWIDAVQQMRKLQSGQGSRSAE